MTLGKIKYLIAFGLTLCLVLTSCKAPTTIKIGLVGTMSGKESDLSVSGRRGAEIAVDEINKQGGLHGKLVELIVKDDENNPETALKVDQALVDEGVKLIIGHFTSGMVLSVIDYINANDVLMLGPTISADQLSQMDDHFIRFIASTNDQAMVISEDVKQKELKNVMVVYDERNRGFTEKLVENFEKLVFDKTGKATSVVVYNPDEPLTKEQAIDTIIDNSPDGLFVVASAEECASIAQAIKTTLKDTQLYGPLWANTQELIKKGGVFVEDMILVGAIDYESEATPFKSFSDAFYAKYGELPTFASVYTYETTMALLNVIDETNSEDPTTLKNKMIETSVFSGLQELVVIDAYGDNLREYSIYQIKSGVLKKVGTYDN